MTLDEAWAEAQAALPEGAYVTSVASYLVHPRTGRPAEWTATATHETRTWNSGIDARGPTPAAALHALAVRLKEKPRVE